MSPEELFWSLVDRSGGPDACWPWQGCVDQDGYGRFSWEGQQDRAHRKALELDGRPVPAGGVGRHLCNFTRCCNPKHLMPGTQRDNILDAKAAGRWTGGKRRLSVEQAELLRTWYRKGLATSGELALIFGIGPQRVRHIGTDEPYRGRRRNGGRTNSGAPSGCGAAAVPVDWPGADRRGAAAADRAGGAAAMRGA